MANNAERFLAYVRFHFPDTLETCFRDGRKSPNGFTSSPKAVRTRYPSAAVLGLFTLRAELGVEHHSLLDILEQTKTKTEAGVRRPGRRRIEHHSRPFQDFMWSDKPLDRKTLEAFCRGIEANADQREDLLSFAELPGAGKEGVSEDAANSFLYELRAKHQPLKDDADADADADDETKAEADAEALAREPLSAPRVLGALTPRPADAGEDVDQRRQKEFERWTEAEAEAGAGAGSDGVAETADADVAAAGAAAETAADVHAKIEIGRDGRLHIAFLLCGAFFAVLLVGIALVIPAAMKARGADSPNGPASSTSARPGHTAELLVTDGFHADRWKEVVNLTQSGSFFKAKLEYTNGSEVPVHQPLAIWLSYPIQFMRVDAGGASGRPSHWIKARADGNVRTFDALALDAVVQPNESITFTFGFITTRPICETDNATPIFGRIGTLDRLPEKDSDSPAVFKTLPGLRGSLTATVLLPRGC